MVAAPSSLRLLAPLASDSRCGRRRGIRNRLGVPNVVGDLIQLFSRGAEALLGELGCTVRLLGHAPLRRPEEQEQGRLVGDEREPAHSSLVSIAVEASSVGYRT